MRFALLALLLLLAACTRADAPPETLAERLAAPEAQVVDVRTSAEFNAGHLVGARHANLLDGSFEQLIPSLDPERPVYVYCGTGQRSERAAAMLRERGFQNVTNAGSFSALARAGAPVAP
ncbi:MAG: rhodanese-like domain-containing protein [Rubricoccaceae bacterium]